MFLVSICRVGILEPAVELTHLRYFVAVAEMENVSRAALTLHVWQPALTRQIRDLEDEIGFSLLERTAKSEHSRWDTRWPASTRIDRSSPEG
jgi:hypothetical protein